MNSEPVFDPIVERGCILVYRVFDLAQEIDLSRVESLMKQDQGHTRVTLVRRGRSAILIRNAPVRLNLGKTSLKVFDKTIVADTFATVWDYGVISIVFQIPVASGTSWAELIPLGVALNGEGPGAEELDPLAQAKSREVVVLLGDAVTPSSFECKIFEDHLIYFFEELRGVSKPDELVKNGTVAKLVLGEGHEKLAPRSLRSIDENVFQYAENDLVAVYWNSAVVLEPSGVRDIPDVIEFALTHLLELRYYDDLLDLRLNRLYDSIKAERQGNWRSNYAQISREANALYLEMSEFLERIDNSLKVLGDFYLAVIFRASNRRLRMADWQSSVSRKMTLLGRVSELLQGEINVQRGHGLEFVVIILITFEIISTLLKNLWTSAGH